MKFNNKYNIYIILVKKLKLKYIINYNINNFLYQFYK